MPILVHAMTNPGNAGDTSSVLAIASKVADAAVIALADNDAAVIAKFTANLDAADEHVLVISNAHGINFLAQALQSPKVQALIAQQRLIVSFSAHQPPMNFNDYAKHLDIVGLLAEAITPELQAKLGRRLVSMEFVPNTLTAETLKTGTALEEWNRKHPDAIISDADNGYIAVFLPGDATDRSGAYKFYSQEDAFYLGLCLGHEAIINHKFLIATNGPRMGKFDPDSPDPRNPIPRVGVHVQGAPMDPVSTAFLVGIKTSGIADDQYRFIDFVNGDSAYTAIACAAYKRNSKSIIFYGAESISQMELGEFFANTYALMVNVMSDLHMAFLLRMNQQYHRVGIARSSNAGISIITTPDPKLKAQFMQFNPASDAQLLANVINAKIALLREVRAARDLPQQTTRTMLEAKATPVDAPQAAATTPAYKLG